jgi:hypothetical protein
MANQTLTIEGAEQEVRCDCCNRKLKVGVRTNLLGTIGADCLIAQIAANRARFSGNGLPTASWVRELAVIRETKTQAWMDRRGFDKPTMWVFQMKDAA